MPCFGSPRMSSSVVPEDGVPLRYEGVAHWDDEHDSDLEHGELLDYDPQSAQAFVKYRAWRESTTQFELAICSTASTSIGQHYLHAVRRRRRRTLRV